MRRTHPPRDGSAARGGSDAGHRGGGRADRRAAVGLPLVIFAVAGYLIGVVWLRPRIGSAYLPVAIGVPVALRAARY